MRPIPQRRLRTIIIGVAMALLGLPTGYVIMFLFFARTLGHPATSLAEAVAQMQGMPSDLMLAVFPVGLGLLCSAAGLFLVIANLLIHFLGAPQPQPCSPLAKPAAAPRPTPTPRATTFPDDSRYMPKPR
ncbi:MAG TPA: hypothetical protein VHI52_13745 [Verrucomicrobiae bacterium]|nr:hypothetical protein [Verrucomicrobiae bacterium]